METSAVRELREQDILPLSQAFQSIGWNKPASQYRRYLSEQKEGSRLVLTAFYKGEFAGYLTIVWHSAYPPFRADGIPEITDLNVLPNLRRKGIGSLLLDEAERRVAERSETIGIGVGLNADYGAAQRLYIRRGYVPDGRGLFWQGRYPKFGDVVTVDDDLVLYLTKDLTA